MVAILTGGDGPLIHFKAAEDHMGPDLKAFQIQPLLNGKNKLEMKKAEDQIRVKHFAKLILLPQPQP